MNILMVHPHDIYSSIEPWTVRIVYIAKEFIKKGHNVKLVYFPLHWDGQKITETPDGITVIPLSRKHGPHIFIPNILKLCSLAEWANVIHFQKCFYHAALPAVIAGILRGKPLHYDWDDWELKIYEVSTKPSLLRNTMRDFLKFLENTLPRVVDTISCASQRLKIECENLGVDRSRIFDAHVGADIKRFNPDISGDSIRQKYKIEKPLILYLGQLHGGQYVETFIQTAARLINDYKKDLTFMIAGDGYQAGELKKLAQRLNLDGKLIFTGAIPHELVPQYIATADVCLACFEENEVTLCKSPLKIVEYLASGKAIVASNVGEVPRMLGMAGILTPPGDINSLADGILKILQDPVLKNSLEKLARERAEKEYNWTVTAINLLKAYGEAIQIKNSK
ncbi:MAG: glycosyltransferase family 4 protein [Candidatus Omnitrophica bacterium]|nr:glycosyltransferase family 4 protein [Candidatus Omnitrophota bacterium]